MENRVTVKIDSTLFDLKLIVHLDQMHKDTFPQTVKTSRILESI